MQQPRPARRDLHPRVDARALLPLPHFSRALPQDDPNRPQEVPCRAGSEPASPRHGPTSESNRRETSQGSARREEALFGRSSASCASRRPSDAMRRRKGRAGHEARRNGAAPPKKAADAVERRTSSEEERRRRGAVLAGSTDLELADRPCESQSQATAPRPCRSSGTSGSARRQQDRRRRGREQQPRSPLDQGEGQPTDRPPARRRRSPRIAGGEARRKNPTRSGTRKATSPLAPAPHRTQVPRTSPDRPASRGGPGRQAGASCRARARRLPARAGRRHASQYAIDLAYSGAAPELGFLRGPSRRLLAGIPLRREPAWTPGRRCSKTELAAATAPNFQACRNVSITRKQRARALAAEEAVREVRASARTRPLISTLPHEPTARSRGGRARPGAGRGHALAAWGGGGASAPDRGRTARAREGDECCGAHRARSQSTR